VDFLNFVLRNFKFPQSLGQYKCGGYQLDAISETGLCADGGEVGQSIFLNFDPLCSASNCQNLHNFVQSVWHQSNNEKTVQEIDRDTVGASHFNAANLTHSAVGGEDYDRGQVRLKSSVEIGETLNVKHVNLIDEQNSRHKLGDAVVNIFVHNFVDFESQFLCNLGLLRSVNLGHQRYEIVASLGPRISYVEIVKSHILDYFLFLVNITFRNRNVFFCLQIEFSRI